MEIPKKRVCVLVRCLNGMQHPKINFQVTLDPDRVWPNTKLIRFGGWSGDKGGMSDELCGWMNLDEWEIVAILGDIADDGVTVITSLE